MTLKEHLDRVFGFESQQLCERNGVEVRVWRDAQNAHMGVICTVGMSKRPQLVPIGQGCPSKEPRVELVAYCRLEDVNAVSELLSDLADFPSTHDTFIFWWHSLPLGRPLVAGSTLDAVLFTFPPYSKDEVTFLVDGKRTDLIWVIPISKSELKFCITEGVEAFEECIISNDVDITDLFRAPLK